MKRRLFRWAVLFGTFAIAGPVATAQELEPRRYSNVPVGVNFVAFGYAYSQGNIFFDPNLPIEDADAKIHAAFARYIRTFSLFGLSSKIKLDLPWASGHWEGTVDGVFRTRSATGVGDARIGIETLFSGAPALRKSEFGTYSQRTIFGASLDVIMPTGEYDPSRLVNLGGNRWILNPEIGFSHKFEKWVMEVGLAGGIFGDNTDYFGGSTLEQDPLYAVKASFIRAFRPGLWLAISVAYGDGGTTTVDGIEKEDRQSNTRAGITFSYLIRPNQGLLVSLLSGYTFRAGPDFDTIAVGYQYSWGG